MVKKENSPEAAKEWQKFRTILKIALAETTFALLVAVPLNIAGYLSIVLWGATIYQGVEAFKSETFKIE